MTNRKKRRQANPVNQLELEYRAILPVTERFCVELSNQINRLLDDGQILLGFPIESRVKKWESLTNKLERLSLRVDSVKDLNDLIGLRLILLFKRDMIEVCKILADNFKVIDQYDTQERLKEDQFGYSSIHFIIELPETWLAVPTLAQLGGIKAEVQVRTFAQHIWAAASHSLQYKQEESVPPPVRRAIYRVSALLETVDLEFERVLEQRDLYRSNISSLDNDAPLNVDLLEEVLDSLLPAINKGSNEEYSNLLTDLLHFDINTRKKLEALVHKHLSKTLELDVKAASEHLSKTKQLKSEYFKHSHARARKGAFHYHCGLTRTMLALEFGKEWKDYGNPE
ncbi:MAG TPA: RelA/SpoT domain-containing protein [Nitrososphaera sp.]|jgi:ppGpp synthetase/RelA/SpoT-type nucleotidyltranferase|nr:RelA/SpoT domain-containing protein [Nitrososphaera sp.]